MSIFVTNFEVGAETCLVRDPQIMHYEGLVNAKFPPDGMTAASGDGTQNDTNAIKELIAYCINNNFPLYFPAGVYLTSPITVSGNLSIIGSGAIIRLRPIMSGPLITLEGGLVAQGVTFDANLSGQTTIQNVIQCNNGEFRFNECTVTGGKSCIIGTIENDCTLNNCVLSNYTEYGMNLEGTGRIISTSVVIPNVASGGAFGFVKLDVSNSYVVAWESLAEVPVGVEITGDSNYINVNFMNAETPVNDEGQNNSWKVISRQDTVFADKGTNYTSTMDETHEIKADTVFLNPTNPLQYGISPSQQTNKWFKTIPMQDGNETQYEVLVNDEKVDWLAQGMVDIRLFGAVGDGVTNNDTAIQNAYNYAVANNMALFIPEGRFVCSLVINMEANSRITGMGRNSVIVHNAEQYGFINVGSDKGSVEIDNFRIEEGDVQEAIRLYGDYSIIHNMDIYYTGSQNAIYVSGNGHRIIDNFIRTTNNTSGYAIYAPSYAGNDGVHWSINVLIANNHINFGFIGIGINKLDGNNVEGITIVNNTLLGQGAGTGNDQRGHYALQLRGVFVAIIANNIIDQIQTAIYIDNTSWNNLDLKIIGNYIGTTGTAILAEGTDYNTYHVTITDNEFLVTGSGSAISMNSSCNEIIIKGNCIQCNSPCLWLTGKNYIVTDNVFSTTDNYYAYLDGQNNTGGMFIFKNNFRQSGKGVTGVGYTDNVNYFNEDYEMK